MSGLKEKNPFTPIYDPEVVARRAERRTPDGRSLRTFSRDIPCLFEKKADEIAVVASRPDILNRSDIWITTGGAASRQSEILPKTEGLKPISQMQAILHKEWWSDVDGSKNQIMAECLLPDMVPQKFLQTIHIVSLEVAKRVQELLPERDVQIVPEPWTIGEIGPVSRAL